MGQTHLVTISPEEVLGADVLVWVLWALLKRWLVGLVLPVLGPQTPGVDAGNADGWDDDAAEDVRCNSNLFSGNGV